MEKMKIYVNIYKLFCYSNVQANTILHIDMYLEKNILYNRRGGKDEGGFLICSFCYCTYEKRRVEPTKICHIDMYLQINYIIIEVLESNI